MSKHKYSLVDFHCHLDLYPDFDQSVIENDILEIHTLTVTTTPRAWARNKELADSSSYLRAALGLHPQLVGERAHERELWKKYLPDARYVGEIGLDAGKRFYRSFERQVEIFEYILTECALAGGKILTVHSIRSAPKVLDLIEDKLGGSDCKVVLHWFTGSAKQAARAAEIGCYFSVNFEMLKKQEHLDMLSKIPLNRILTETDGPFTGPGQRIEILENTLNQLAALKGLTCEHLCRRIIENLNCLEL